MISIHKLLLVVLLTCICRISIVQTKFWEQTNGPTGGRVMSIIFDNSGTLFCGTQGGTLFQYSEKDQIWSPLFLGATRDNIISIVIDEEKRMYFATTSDGVFRSSVQKNSWQKINTGLENLQITGLAILPDGTLFAGTTKGLYKSINGGNNWVKDESLGKSISAIIVYHQIVYVAYNDSLICYSKNGGQNWEYLPELKNNSITCIMAGNNQQVYAAVKSGDVFKSKISDPEWEKIAGFKYPVWSLQTDPAGNIYAGLGGPDFSNEGGGIYFIPADSEKTRLLFTESIWCMVIRNNKIYAGSFFGVHYSDENKTKLLPLNSGLIAQRINDLIINKNDVLFVGSYGGVFSSGDNGKTWIEKNNGLDEKGILDMAINSKGELFVGTYTSGVYRTSDSGNSWQKKSNGIPFKNSHWIMSLVVNSTDQLFAAVLAGGVYRSIDNGDSWHPVNNGLETQRYIALVVDANDVVYAANEEGNVFRSYDNGESWKKIEVLNPIGEAAAELVVDNENRLYFGAVQKGVFCYNEKNRSWTSLNNNSLANTAIRSLIFIDENLIVAGTSGALDYHNFIGEDMYMSADKGKNWSLINSGLDHPRIKALALNSKGFLFAGTWGGGVYKSRNSLK